MNLIQIPQTPCPLFNHDLLLVMMMEITLWFALLGLICFLVVNIIKLQDPNSSISRERRKYNTQRRKQSNAAE